MCRNFTHGPTTDLSQESLPLGLLSADGGFAAYVVELPMVRKKQQAPLAFKSASKLGDWLEKHHGTATELWVRIFKSDTGVPSVTWNDCVIESIRVGWIDGQMKPFDDMSYLQRLTPRKVNSNWSAKNCRHATTLIAEGRMLPAGLAQVEAAKSDGRWDTAYAGSADMTIPQDFLDALEDMPAAKAFFATLDRRNLYSIYYRLHTAKKPETRARRIAQIVAKLDRGEKFH
jgi:uncharacterized protein YdeI (YjbR/CyaY-like superfamily)